ncbi:hypothetical protein [Janibacter alittae]|uniref:Uncharacterized protein n=1 Tax=Janibacter alittae TaxID=3115209 RepID=A0ABZ2MF06_9MICO
MTRHDDPSWGPDDDELVRAALMSLMDDVSDQPLPEPESIRVRAEGGTDEVTDLAVHRSRRRSFAVLAGAAAAAVVATTAGIYVANQSPDRPVATSSTHEETTSGSSTAASRLTMLSAGTWSAVLDRSVRATTTDTPDGGSCFETTDDASWTRGAPRLADGSVPAVQWIGLPESGSQPPTHAVDDALERCSDLAITDTTRGTLGDGAAYRGWRLEPATGGSVWWVEVTDGGGLSLLTVPVSDGLRDTGDVRELARAVVGEADLTRQTSTSTTSDPTETDTVTATTTAPSPTTTVIPPPDPTGTSTGDTAGTGATASPSSSSSSDSPTDVIDSARFVPADQWASPALTGGAATTSGPLRLEGAPPYIEACITSELEAPVAATGIRSGPGEDNYFGRQYIALASDPDAVRSELLAGYSSGACPGPAIGGTSTQLTSNIFRLQHGDLTNYIAVVRIQGRGVSVLELAEAKTAPRALTDSVAVSELTRMSDLAAVR